MPCPHLRTVSFVLLAAASTHCTGKAPTHAFVAEPEGAGDGMTDSVAPAFPMAGGEPAPAQPSGTPPSTEMVAPTALVTPTSPAPAGTGATVPPVSDPVATTPAAPGADRCDVGVYDPNNPPQSLALSGSLNAHDPVIVAAGGSYHFFSTGNGISVKTSPDLLNWSAGAPVFASAPAWFQQLVPGYAGRSVWAPDVSYFGGQYHLYYAVSTFGSNRSCIGHATRADLDAGEWTDHEAAFCSNQPGQNDNYNAIDPNVVLDEAGSPWLSFGSFWSGIKMIHLDLNGDRVGTELIDLASRGGGAIEGPFIVRRCGYYYLFVSFDACCQGLNSTYNLRVGRSPTLSGPYVDRAGTAMMNGGGTLVLQKGGDWIAPGHNAVLFDGTRAYNVYHALTATNGASMLRISELVWDSDGWPISGGP